MENTNRDVRSVVAEGLGYTDRQVDQTDQKIHWVNLITIVVIHLAALAISWYYIATYGFEWVDLVPFAFMYLMCGFAITGGYHRLFAHRTYEAHPILKAIWLCFGSGAVQNSAYIWSADHRVHHLYADRDQDPYNVKKGFWWAHIGWIFFQDTGERDLENVRDLEKDPLVMWQHRNYLLLTLIFVVALPTVIGGFFGRPFAGFVWGGLIRLVLTYHVTFLINSAAHYVGSQPYSCDQSARQCWPIIPLSLGEAYHNFHHVFAADYRNGEKWFHFDPTKWLIFGMSKVGLAKNLKRTPRSLIQSARAQTKLARESENS